jgi:hypothetical protein
LNPLIIFGLIQGVVTLISKFMDGKKTKAGIGLVAVGTGVSAVSLWGVDVAPDQILSGIKQLLGLVGYQVSSVADQTGQSLLGNLLSFVGSALALYGYYRKGELVKKGQ